VSVPVEPSQGAEDGLLIDLSDTSNSDTQPKTPTSPLRRNKTESLIDTSIAEKYQYLPPPLSEQNAVSVSDDPFEVTLDVKNLGAGVHSTGSTSRPLSSSFLQPYTSAGQLFGSSSSPQLFDTMSSEPGHSQQDQYSCSTGGTESSPVYSNATFRQPYTSTGMTSVSTTNSMSSSVYTGSGMLPSAQPCSSGEDQPPNPPPPRNYANVPGCETTSPKNKPLPPLPGEGAAHQQRSHVESGRSPRHGAEGIYYSLPPQEWSPTKGTSPRRFKQDKFGRDTSANLNQGPTEKIESEKVFDWLSNAVAEFSLGKSGTETTGTDKSKVTSADLQQPLVVGMPAEKSLPNGRTSARPKTTGSSRSPSRRSRGGDLGESGSPPLPPRESGQYYANVGPRIHPVICDGQQQSWTHYWLLPNRGTDQSQQGAAPTAQVKPFCVGKTSPYKNLSSINYSSSSDKGSGSGAGSVVDIEGAYGGGGTSWSGMTGMRPTGGQAYYTNHSNMGTATTTTTAPMSPDSLGQLRQMMASVQTQVYNN
jgi:hypothetical protein